MIQNVINSWFAVAVITLTNVSQFILSTTLLANGRDVTCHATTFIAYSSAFIVIPIVFVTKSIIASHTMNITCRCISILVLAVIIPTSMTILYVYCYIHCPISNAVSWFIEGFSIPALTYTLYKLLRYKKDRECTKHLPDETVLY